MQSDIRSSNESNFNKNYYLNACIYLKLPLNLKYINKNIPQRRTLISNSQERSLQLWDPQNFIKIISMRLGKLWPHLKFKLQIHWKKSFNLFRDKSIWRECDLNDMKWKDLLINKILLFHITFKLIQEFDQTYQI